MVGARTRRAAAGFTLIELVVVIVILGILAATALPKFVNLGSDARASTIVAATGAIKSAVVLTKAKVMVTGMPVDSTVRQLDIGGGNMIDVKYGVPACTANGIRKASGTESYSWYIGGSDLCTLYTNKGRNSNGSTIYTAGCAVVYDASNGGTWTPETSGC